MKDEAGAPVQTLSSPPPTPLTPAGSAALESWVTHPSSDACLSWSVGLPPPGAQVPAQETPVRARLCSQGPSPGGLCVSTLLSPCSRFSALCVDETGAGSARLMGVPLQTPQPRLQHREHARRRPVLSICSGAPVC